MIWLFPTNPALGRRLDKIESALISILKELKTMSAATDNLTAAVAALTTTVNATVAALDDLAAKLAAAIAGGVSDPAVQAAADELATLSANLSAAVAKDDPAS